MKRGSTSWEAQRQKQIDEFTQGWSWGRVYWHWVSRLQDFGIALEPLFQVVKVHDPKNPVGRTVEVACWPAKAMQEKHIDCQRHFDEFPGTRGPTHPGTRRSVSVGEAVTVDYLWEQRADIEVVAAILIAASLFPRMQSARRHYPENWPPFFAVERLLDWANERWQGSKNHQGWHYSCTTVLPYMSEDSIYKIDSMCALVRYLAEEHASFLLQYRLVAVEFSEERDPFVAHVLSQKYKKEEHQRAEWLKRQDEEEKAEKQRIAELKLKHPRYGEWASLSADELERLVWSKAVSLLAEEFGVSDSAIGKRCRALGIMKPSRGFWNQVSAGKIPHPQGKPPIARAKKAPPKLKVVH